MAKPKCKNPDVYARRSIGKKFKHAYNRWKDKKKRGKDPGPYFAGAMVYWCGCDRCIPIPKANRWSDGWLLQEQLGDMEDDSDLDMFPEE